ncbi:halocyanin domain-containing protein [Saliphagus infecundisoli]|uniref:Halocyanin domain-containing protein n=1 Tax=Saliphagus infecundisoli TaxID=1849069 RepID=A0ABD5Q919_9EURY|nr:halocyanin domain-containing protein [Saliphagus infecundisoli]
MSTIDTCPNVNRRQFLQTATVLAVGTTAIGAAQPVTAQQDTDLTSWFGDVSNYDGIVDERSKANVTVDVGAEGNGGGFAFGPPAVRVDPGTTVTWEWTGEGGSHDVVAENGAYESEMIATAGETFEFSFEDEGVSTYACTPHKAMGMKGAVIVGDAEMNVASPESLSQSPQASEFADQEPDYGDWFDDVDNFEGTLDLRGQDEVRIEVGANGNGRGFALSPPAVHIDPGTHVIWEWVGDDGPHGFMANNGEYASPSQSTGEWGLAFDGVGISKYACEPHEDRGMKGAIVVGDVFEGAYELTTDHLTLLSGVGLTGALLSMFALAVRSKTQNHRNDSKRT